MRLCFRTKSNFQILFSLVLTVIPTVASAHDFFTSAAVSDQSRSLSLGLSSDLFSVHDKSFVFSVGFRSTVYQSDKLLTRTANPKSIGRSEIEEVDVEEVLIVGSNAFASLSYTFAEVFAGINLDLVGLSFGRCSAVTSRYDSKKAHSCPQKLNLFIFNDYDFGNLNSEFFLGTMIKEHYSIRAGVAHQFIEVVADTDLAYENRRFRAKVNALFFSSGLRF